MLPRSVPRVRASRAEEWPPGASERTTMKVTPSGVPGRWELPASPRIWVTGLEPRYWSVKVPGARKTISSPPCSSSPGSSPPRPTGRSPRTDPRPDAGSYGGWPVFASPKRCRPRRGNSSRGRPGSSLVITVSPPRPLPVVWKDASR